MNISINICRRFFINLLIFATIISISGKTLAQNINDNTIKSLFIIKFIESTEWQQPENQTPIIGIVDVNQVFKNELILFLRKKAVDYKVVYVESYRDIPKCNLLFVDAFFNTKLKQIYTSMENTGTLLITNDYKRLDYTMINFYKERNNVRFELNFTNIEKQKLKLDPLLRIFGGDIGLLIEKLQTTKDELAAERGQKEELLREISSYRTNINLQKQTIEAQIDSIKTQEKNIADQLEEIENSNQTKNRLQNKITTQRQNISKIASALQSQRNEIASQGKKIRRQQLDVKKSKDTLVLTNKKIKDSKKQFKELEEKTIFLTNQVHLQRILIWGSVVIIVIILLLIVFLIRTSNQNKAKNEELRTKHYEILQQSEELTTQSEELQKLNLLLDQQRIKAETAYKQLKNTQTQLLQSEKMASIGQLTAGIAHEINNPVNFIHSGIEALKDILDRINHILKEYEKINSENLKTQLDTIAKLKDEYEYDELLIGIDELTASIRTGAQRTSHIVKGLRTFARTGSAEPQHTDIQKSIDTTLIMLHYQYRDKINIVKNYNAIPQILCFPDKLNQVFMNILSNSIQAIEGRGEIVITTTLHKSEKQEDKLKISFSDSGCGIPDDIKSKIFDPFFTTKEIGKGTGLGLSISYNIIQEHNGNIEIINNKDKGTTLVVYLPIKT